MVFEFGESINKLIDKLLSAPVIHKIASNPIYTAIVIVLLLMVIVLFVFREVDAEESLEILTLRSGFWMFIGIVSVLMLHNRVLIDEVKNMKKSSVIDEVFEPVIDTSERVPINIQSSD